MGVHETFTETISLPPPKEGTISDRPEDIYGQGPTRELALRDLVQRCAGEMNVYKSALRSAFAALSKFQKSEWKAENKFMAMMKEDLTHDEKEAYELSNGQY